MSDMTLFYAEMTQFEEPAPDRAADRIRYRSVWRPWGLRFEWALVPQLWAMTGLADLGFQGALTVWSFPELPVQARLCDGWESVRMPPGHCRTRISIQSILRIEFLDLNSGVTSNG